MSSTFEGPASAMAAVIAAMLTTPLSLLLLGLVALNIAGLLHPRSLLSRGVGAALLLPLLLLLALPLPGALLGPMLQAVIPVLVLLLAALLGRQPAGGHRATEAPAGASPAYVAMAIAASLGIGLLLALRGLPFEYPGDSTDYLQSFIQGHLESPPSRSCLVEGLRQPTYQRFCTLWSVILQAGHLEAASLLSGIPQRLTILLEVGVLGLSYFRLLQAARVGAAAAGLSWLLVAFGLGNQAISFLVNHSLQGSILAAAIFLEAVMVMLRLQLRPSAPPRQAGSVIAALLVFLMLAMKLHGAFALCTLALLIPLQSLIAAARLLGHLKHRRGAFAALARPTARWLLITSLGLLALVLTFKTGWLVNKQGRFIVPWGFLSWLGLPPHALPGSYLMRTPGSRPEALAVISIVIGIAQLARCWRPGSDSGEAAPPATPAMAASLPGRPDQREADLYPVVASLNSVAVLVAFLLPPFSHLFINLPYEVNSNYRLMWSCILFSPLPCLLDAALTPRRSGLTEKLVAMISTLVVLLPLPAGSGQRGQLFWSKTRHILEGPSPRVDMQRVARALMPSLAEIRASEGGRAVVVLADELVGSALIGYSKLVVPIHATRVTSNRELSNWETHGLLRKALSESDLLKVLRELKKRPDLIIQESPISSYYSPYSEIRVYDPDIATRVTTSGVNALTPDLLRQAGFCLWRRLDTQGKPIQDPSFKRQGGQDPACFEPINPGQVGSDRSPWNAGYTIWKRMP